MCLNHLYQCTLTAPSILMSEVSLKLYQIFQFDKSIRLCRQQIYRGTSAPLGRKDFNRRTPRIEGQRTKLKIGRICRRGRRGIHLRLGIESGRSKPPAECLMPLAVPLGNACPLVAGSGHGRIYNSLIIRYHLTPSVESQPFFGHNSTLHFIKY